MIYIDCVVFYSIWQESRLIVLVLCPLVDQGNGDSSQVVCIKIAKYTLNIAFIGNGYHLQW